MKRSTRALVLAVLAARTQFHRQLRPRLLGKTAYQGNYDGFRIIDVAEPDNPVELNDYRECAGKPGRRERLGAHPRAVMEPAGPLTATHCA
jgi:hypothetical protein